MAAGVALGQVGEFSFVLATAAAGYGLLRGDLFALVLSVTVGTLFLASYQVGWALPAARRICSLISRGAPEPESSGAHSHDHNPVLVVGFGPAGRRLVEELRAQDLSPEILELNTKAPGARAGTPASTRTSGTPRTRKSWNTRACATCAPWSSLCRTRAQPGKSPNAYASWPRTCP